MADTPRYPFPAQPPVSIIEPEAIRENDWEAFRSLTSVENHWALRKWKPGRSVFYWYLTFGDPDLISLAKQCQEFLGYDTLDHVPQEGFHMTLFGIGNAEDICEDDLVRLAELTREGLKIFKPFRVTIGPLAGSRSAVRFSVAPWDSLMNLYLILRDCTMRVWPDNEIAHVAEFRPHVGIAYINEQQSSRALVDKVSKLRNLPPVTAEINSVRIVRLWRADHRYQWYDQEVVPLYN